MTNIAVILAGGIGTRIGGGIPKQLLPLSDGRSILEHSIDAFEAAPCIHRIGIVMHADYIAQAQQLILRNTWQKVVWVIPGGNERYESSLNAIRHIQKTFADKIDSANINILLHDAARPFVSQQIIQDVCNALQQHEAVTVALPATDTIYQVIGSVCASAYNNANNTTGDAKNENSGNYGNYANNTTGNANNKHNGNNGNYANNRDDCVITSIPPRPTLMYAQTPQAFRLPIITEAYRLALQNIEAQTSALSGSPHLPATDDCSVLHQYLPHIPIHIVLGTPTNRKITYKEDL